MLKINLIIFLISMFLISSCGNLKNINSTDVLQEIKIDGKIDDWTNEDIFTTKDNVKVSVKNDKFTIFIKFSTDNKELQRKINSEGFFLWLNYKGNQDKDFGMNYPIGARYFKPKNDDNDNDNNDEDSRKELFKEMFGYLRLIASDGRSSDNISTFETSNKFGIEVASRKNFDLINYEIALPIDNKIASLKPSTIKDNYIGIGLQFGREKALSSNKTNTGVTNIEHKEASTASPNFGMRAQSNPKVKLNSEYSSNDKGAIYHWFKVKLK